MASKPLVGAHRVPSSLKCRTVGREYQPVVHRLRCRLRGS